MGCEYAEADVKDKNCRNREASSESAEVIRGRETGESSHTHHSSRIAPGHGASVIPIPKPDGLPR